MPIKHNYNEQITGADTVSPSRNNVNVYTRMGQFVANVPVIPFQKPPEVLIWGQRVFHLTQYQIGEFLPPKYCYQYREAFAYTIPTGFNGAEYSRSLQGDVEGQS